MKKKFSKTTQAPLKSTALAQKTAKKKITARSGDSTEDSSGFDIDVEDLNGYRDRQGPISREIENDPGIFEN